MTLKTINYNPINLQVCLQFEPLGLPPEEDLLVLGIWRQVVERGAPLQVVAGGPLVDGLGKNSTGQPVKSLLHFLLKQKFVKGTS